ncbi:MAG: hypothetical protein IT304_09450 [Dehalococcoidia bacterium]|nr:hypothetical protein [Dehalococcoidia bacterium]
MSSEPSLVCAWCGALLRLAGELISHGICSHCLEGVEVQEVSDPSRRRRRAAASPRRARRPRPVAVQLFLPLPTVGAPMALGLPLA